MSFLVCWEDVDGLYYETALSSLDKARSHAGWLSEAEGRCVTIVDDDGNEYPLEH